MALFCFFVLPRTYTVCMPRLITATKTYTVTIHFILYYAIHGSAPAHKHRLLTTKNTSIKTTSKIQKRKYKSKSAELRTLSPPTRNRATADRTLIGGHTLPVDGWYDGVLLRWAEMLENMFCLTSAMGDAPVTRIGSCLCHEHITNSVIGVSRPPVLDCGTTFHLDSGGRDLPSTLSDSLWKLIYLATEPLDSFEFIGAI